MSAKIAYRRVSGSASEGVTTPTRRNLEISTLFVRCGVVREWQTISLLTQGMGAYCGNPRPTISAKPSPPLISPLFHHEFILIYVSATGKFRLLFDLASPEERRAPIFQARACTVHSKLTTPVISEETFSRNSGWQISSTNEKETICQNRLFISGLCEVGLSSRISCHEVVVSD